MTDTPKMQFTHCDPDSLLTGADLNNLFDILNKCDITASELLMAELEANKVGGSVYRANPEG